MMDIEEGFLSIIVHKDQPDEKSYDAIVKQVEAMTDDAKETFIADYLLNASTCNTKTKLKKILDNLHKLTVENKISSRALCEQILKCDGLRINNKPFWIEGFGLIRRVLANVDYKGVREVMKGCNEKALRFPHDLTSSNLSQMQALISVFEYIFDRNACLLPAYFIINEIQKPENADTHWRLKKLISNYTEEFVDTAQMLSMIGYPEKLPVVEFSAYVDHIRLDPTTLRFILKGQLPYNPALLQPQTKLLRYVLEQPCSRDFVCSILNLNKNQRIGNPQLEQNFIWLILSAMEKSELTPASADDPIPPHWLHLSSQLIYFVLFSFVAFSNIVTQLHQTLMQKDLRRGRNYLMWVLLQFISGSIQRNPLQTFLPMLKLFDILYPEKEPLPVPNIMSPACTHQMAATCIWLHLTRKAQLENQQRINWTVPPAFKAHLEFFQAMAMPNNAANLSLNKDYSIALLCNAYSTNQDFFSRPMGVLIDFILGPSKNIGSTAVQLPTAPLSMSILDSLTVHSKMSLIHSIVTHMIKQAQVKSSLPSNITNMAPALVETYSRLLVYTEIESLGIKGFLSQLLPTVFKNQAWSILYTLLEMFMYRIEWHIQPHYRCQLLSHLQTLAGLPVTDQNQLHHCVEFTALRLIAGFGSSECKHLVDTKPSSGSVMSNDSEELNRLLVLLLARSLHITATGNDPAKSSWCKDMLTTISQHTPLAWNTYTLNCFPQFLKDHYAQNNVTRDIKQILKTVDEEYRNWMNMGENDIISHFSLPTTTTFLCVLFKAHLDTEKINPIALKVLERVGAKLLVENVRKLCDYLVMLSACNTSSASGSIMPKAAESINAMIWKYHIFTIDRFIFCLALRSYDGSEVQISFYLIQLVLIKNAEFRNRTQEFVKENSPEHWKQTNWYEKHDSFHKKYPEKFNASDSVQQLPVYFGNVCLRMIPVIDIVIHRLLEISTPTLHKTLEFLLDHLGCLYKFHDRPITYLYNTLHYYEVKLRDKPLIKKKLVATIIGSLHEVHPPNWALSELYRNYIKTPPQENETGNFWTPDLGYYIGLVRRLLDTMDGRSTFPTMDWRFNEFPNSATHALYVTCVELLSLPVAPSTVTNSLIDVIVKGQVATTQGNIHSWINVVGLIISRLPEVFWSVIFERLQKVMESPEMRDWTYQTSPFQVFNFKSCTDCMIDKYCVSLLAISQSVFHHFGVGQISMVMDNIKKTLKPIIKHEQQLIYLCHIVGPFIQRFEAETPRAVMNLTALLYEVLEQVDKNSPNQSLSYIDPVCDLLYHLKYQFIGDTMKNDLEAIIKRLRPPLRMKLRFITRLNVDEVKEC